MLVPCPSLFLFSFPSLSYIFFLPLTNLPFAHHLPVSFSLFWHPLPLSFPSFAPSPAVSPGTVLEEQIVIGTPGTMLDWCFKRRLLNMRRICMFVLDEADVMIDTQGFSSQSIRIQRALPKDCQMLLFSATFKETLWKFALQIVSRPIIIKLRQEELTLTNIRQYYFVCRNWEQKYEALCNLYGSITIGQAMIFCQTRRSADWLSVKMIQDGHQVAMLTAELSIVQRADVIQRFRDGKEKVLITTNVCARETKIKRLDPDCMDKLEELEN